MARDTININSKGGDRDFKTEDTRGIREDKGVQIGIVKVNSHPTRMGIISVFVPNFGNSGEQGGKKLEDEPTQWRQVRYATPFYSVTQSNSPAVDQVNTKNPSGFVFPAPDLNSRVLCVFPEGRNAEGFWFACAPDVYMMQSLPEASASANHTPGKVVPRNAQAPSLEFNDLANDTRSLTNYLQPKRAIADNILSALISQGLDQDSIRGLSTSSIMRETPSEVIGITSKGRRIDKTGKDISARNDILEALANDADLTPEQDDVLTKPIARKKGHSFVLDDGDLHGNNNLMRMRTASGHQVLLHDTQGIIYIGNGSGTCWLQFDNNGQIDVFSDHNINLRTKNFNFHADENIRFHAKKTIQMVADENWHLEAGKMINIHTEKGSLYEFAGEQVHIKSGGPASIQAAQQMNLKAGPNMQIQAERIDLNGNAADAQSQSKAHGYKWDDVAIPEDYWEPDPEVIETTVDRVPTHEPYKGHTEVTQASIYKQKLAEQVTRVLTPVAPKSQPPVTNTGAEVAKGEVNNEKVRPVDVIKQPESTVQIGMLDSNTVKAIQAGVASTINKAMSYVNEVATTGALGKYGANAEQLQKAGYVKPDAVFNSSLSDPKMWTGKDGVLGKSDFLNSGTVQEKLFSNTMLDNYQTMVNTGAVQLTDDVSTVAGMVTASIATTPDVAKKFREGLTIEPRPLPGTTMIQSTETLTSSVKQMFKLGLSAAKVAENNFGNTSIYTDEDIEF